MGTNPASPTSTAPAASTDRSWVGSDVIPFAKPADVRMAVRGTYPNGWPSGAVVHYTAGNDRAGAALATIHQGVGDGYTYLCVDRDGTLIQAHPVSKWGYHAGDSKWPKLLGGLNDDFIGIEICCPGILTVQKDGSLKTWYGEVVNKADARYVTLELYGCPTGWYKKYSEAQEAMLVKILKWLKANDPSGRFSYDNVVGHHEISGPLGMGPLKPFRKSDPGGSLSMSMPALRQRLISGTI